MIAKLKLFLEESRLEFQRVNWPTLNETVRLTVIVIAMSLGVAFFLGVVDFSLTSGLSKLINF